MVELGVPSLPGPQFLPLWRKARLFEAKWDGDVFHSVAGEDRCTPGLGEVTKDHVKAAEWRSEKPG